MKAKFIGTFDTVSLIYGKIYDVIDVEHGMYRIIDEEGYDENEEVQGYLFPPELFEVVEE